MKKDNRIDILDGFRFIAIISVIFFHFFSRYSYADYYKPDPVLSRVFSYGFFGVRFFFMLSGFVIFYTLEKTKSYTVFLLKRIVRLFPPILLCSLLTFFLVDILDPKIDLLEFHSTRWNFLPSLTFTSPAIWNTLLHVRHIRYINGSYWSLSVEVIFYLMSGALYFLNKAKFMANWVMLILAFATVNICALAYAHYTHSHSLDIIPKVVEKLGLSYFTMGILFYSLYFSKTIPKVIFAGFILIIIYQFCMEEDIYLKAIFLGMIGLFLLFIYKSHFLNFLKMKWITRIGVSSYSLYLIHEYLGVVLIHKLSAGIQNIVLLRVIIISVIVAFILVAELIYRFYERPVNAFLKKKISGL